jgi:hypothetical protein
MLCWDACAAFFLVLITMILAMRTKDAFTGDLDEAHLLLRTVIEVTLLAATIAYFVWRYRSKQQTPR